ncbi:DUF3854 domain-containing protein (plasmid) [Enterocloster clostridioformis]
MKSLHEYRDNDSLASGYELMRAGEESEGKKLDNIVKVYHEVSKIRRCPICGKPDWCCFVEKDSSTGEELVVCMRDTMECNVEGMDGKRYVYLRKSKLGNSVFEEFEQYNASNRYKMKKDYKFEKAKEQRQLTPVGIIEPRDNPYLNKIYREAQQILSLDEYHRNYLKGKGWTDELMDFHSVVTFPEDDNLRVRYRNRYKSRSVYRKPLAEKLTEKNGPDGLRGVPGAYKQNNAWTFYGRSGILFPMYDFGQNVKRLRIRMDYRDQDRPIFKDTEGYYYIRDNIRYYISMSGIYSLQGQNRVYIKVPGKYRTLSSFEQDEEAEKEGFFANRLYMGCQSQNEYSLYTRPGDDCSVFILTEGEPKGIFTNYKMGYPVLTTSGVSSYMQLAKSEITETCKKMGMKMMVVASDADKAENKKVMDMELKLIQGLRSLGVVVGVAEWEEKHGNGIDDCLASGRWPSFRLV